MTKQRTTNGVRRSWAARGRWNLADGARLNLEALEDRSMLAADPLHNAENPYDVFGNGKITPLDVLGEITYLNNLADASDANNSSSSTVHAMTAVAASSGASSGNSSTVLYPDVLGTGTVTPLDLLAEINAVDAQPAISPDLMEVSLEAVNASGVPITSIQVGQTFYLAMFTTDLETSTNLQGVFSAYSDITYTPGLATVAQPGAGDPTNSVFQYEDATNAGATPPQVNNAWSVFTTGDTTTADQINNAGASQPGVSYAGGTLGAASEMWTVPVTATAAGDLTFTPNFDNNDDFPDAVYSQGGVGLTADQVEFVGTSVTVTSEPSVSIGAGSAMNSTSNTTTLNIPVTLSSASTAPTVITYSTTNGTGTAGAIAGTDYQAVADGQVTIAAGLTSGSLPVTIDQAGTAQVGEENKNFTVTINNVSNSATGATIGTGTATATIVNTDFPTVTLTAPTSVTAPQSGSGTYDFTASLAAGQSTEVPITIVYSTVNNGTGTAGTDYTAVTNGTATIEPGSTSVQIPITIFNDPTRSTSTFSVALSTSSTSVVVGSPGSAVGTIDDLPSITVQPVEQTAPPTGPTTMTFTATLSQAAPVGGITLDYQTADGTATNGVEYTAQNSSVTVLAGNTTATFTIPILAPTVYEGQTQFTVSFSLPGTETDVALGTSSVTGTIDPAVAEPVLSVSASPFEDPVGTSLTTGTNSYPFTVSIPTPSGVATTFSYFTTDGSAKNGVDYTGTQTGTGTITAGQTSTTIYIPVQEYNVNEATKTFTVTLSSPTNATLSPTNATAQGQIESQVAEPTISLNTPVYTDVTSGTGEVPVVISLLNSSSQATTSGQAISFNYTTTNGTAIAGTNYTTTSGSTTIPAGQSSITIDVPFVAEPDYTPSLNFTFAISNVTNVSGSTSASTTATVNSQASEPTLSIANFSSAVSSSSTTTFPFTVTLSAPSSVATTVNYATADGTALAGTDYVAASNTLTIPAGQTTGTIDVTVDAETITTDKTFTVTLSSPTNATINTATATGTLLAYLPSSISGYDFVDINENGKMTASSTVLPGVTISLSGTSSVTNTAVSMSTTTGSNGAYTFTNLTPGVYTLTETEPSGYVHPEALPGDSNVTTPAANQLVFTITGLGGLTSVNDNFAFYGQSAASISQRGYLSSDGTTAAAAVSAASGNSSSGNSSTANDAVAGQRTMLAAASGSSADAAASNVVLNGSTLTVTGDGGNDSFGFTAGTTVDTVTFNGVSSTYNAASLKSVVFDGTGEGAATITGLGAATASLNFGAATLTGAGYTVTVNNVNAVTINNGGSGGSALLSDSSLVDHLFAEGDLASLSNAAGDTISVDGFASVAVATASGGSLTKDIRSIDFALSEN